jgi:hypothetical protein
MYAASSRWIAAALLWVALGIPVPAAADAKDELQQGIAAYNIGEMERAEALLRVALPKLTDPKDQAQAWMYIGFSQANRGALPAARESFTTALGFDPTVQPNPDRIPPPVVVEFHEVRRALTGLLRVEASEGDAHVFIDDVERGATPLEVRVPLGVHKVKLLSKDHFRVAEASVLVGVRGIARVDARLAARPGRLQLNLDPPGTEVSEDGRPLPPERPLPLPAGPHRLTFRAPGREATSREVVVQPEKITVFELRLREAVAPPPWYARRRPWGYLMIGLAGGALAAGIFVGKSAQASDDAIHSGQDVGTLNYTRFQVLASSASSNARTANIFFGAAGAVGLTGLVLVLTGGKGDTARAGWRVAPSPGGIAFVRGF